jgi:hypothetical protein
MNLLEVEVSGDRPTAFGVGDAVDLTVDTAELHFFDPANGLALA